MRRVTALLALLLAGSLLAAACSSDDSSENAASDTSAAAGDTTTSAAASGDQSITVFAASSLTDAFTEIGQQFEDANPGSSVEFNFGASSDLVDSITSGDALGTADVFASADTSNMDKLTEADAAAADPEVFAQNQAEIAVPAGNPGDVQGLDDFANEDLTIALCAEDVPCGTYARQVLDNAGVTPSVDTNEAKVTDVVAKVASRDVDAGIVYVTDVLANDDDVDGIEIPDEVNVLATYPIAPVVESEASATAAHFVAFVLSDDGQAVLADYGFLPPS